MEYKKTFKLMLCALLLGASASAFADGDETTGVTDPKVVQLSNNGGTISWSDFVDAINGTKNVGTVSQSVQNNVNKAQKAYNSAEQDVKDKEKALEDAKKALSELTDEKINTLNKAVIDAKEQLLKDQTSATTLEGEINDLDDKIAGYDKSIQTAQEKIDAAESTITNARNQLRSLQKVTETKTDTVGWMKDMLKLANLFSDNYNLTPASSRPETPVIYYYKEYNEDDEETTLFLSFNSTQPTVAGDWKQINPKNFRSTLTTSTAGPVDFLSLYMGSEFAKQNNGNAYYTIKDYQGNKTYIVQTALGGIETLAGQSKYQSTTTTVTDKYVDQDLADEIIEEMNDAQATITQETRNIKGWHSTSQGWKEGDTEVNGYEELKAIADSTRTTKQSSLDAFNETTIPTDQKAVENAETKYKEEVTDVQNGPTTAQAALDEATAALETAKEEFQTAKDNLETAQANANANVLAQNYQKVTLTGNVDATSETLITKDYSGTIWGKGFVINVPTGKTLFETFEGTLNKAAVNGSFAASYSKATFEEVAVNTGSAFRFYNDHGQQTTTNSFNELAFEVRELYGVDFEKTQLAKLTDDNKVYKLEVYQENIEANPLTNYVVYKNKTFINSDNKTVVIPTNRFAKSATYDIANCEGITNVFYVNKNGNTVCDNVKIEDRINFYCPETITATSLQYERTFNKGKNAVCLPFELKKYSDDINLLCKFDGETTDKFWFTKVADNGSIPANTPALLVAENEFKFESLNLSDITIAPTPKLQKVEDEGNEDDPSKSYGIFKEHSRDDIAGALSTNKVYGMGGGEFRLAADKANFPAFRMVLLSGFQKQTSSVRSIGILDENGVEITDITTGVESMKVDASSLSVAGGQGEISFTSEADYGNVAIYTLDGKVVAIANVMAGTTTVNVQKGLYVVMGKKVMVK